MPLCPTTASTTTASSSARSHDEPTAGEQAEEQAAGGGEVEGREAIFALTLEGQLLFSFEQHRHSHASLTAGDMVAAAGTMRVLDGRLISLDNGSGHYRPPPESLARVSAHLQSMGVHMARVSLHVCAGPGTLHRGDRIHPTSRQLSFSRPSLLQLSAQMLTSSSAHLRFPAFLR